MPPRIDITKVATGALARAESLLSQWFPAGKRTGREWVLGGLDGSPGRSLSINLDRGSWGDFATGDKGGDLVSLRAARDRINQLEAARAISAELGLEAAAPPKRAPKPAAEPDYAPIMPVDPAPSPEPGLRHFQHGEAVARWRYLDADGRLLHYVARYQNAETGKKEIVPWTYGADKHGKVRWQMRHAPAPRPLYGLEHLARNADAPVIIVEGEKATDAARRIMGDRVVVVTWSGGGNAVHKADWSPLAGRRCLIWPDDDKPGIAAADKVTAALMQVGSRSCSVLTVDGIAKDGGWDLADGEAEGWDARAVDRKMRESRKTVWDGVNTTIEEARREDEARRTPEADAPACLADGPPADGKVVEIPELRPDGLPGGFRVKPDGIERLIEMKEGESEWRHLCSPIRVVALPRDSAGTGWGRLVEITDPDGRVHRWAIPAEMFAGDGTELRRAAFSLGLDLIPGRGAKEAFTALLTMWRPRARAYTSDRLGWSGEDCRAFVLGDGRVIGANDVVFQAEQVPGAAREMRQAGTLEEWRETVSAACTGNPLLMLGVSLALAGPLLEPLSCDGGGIHLRGASSRGKSTILNAAVSAWGSPRFKQSWRATANGLEGVAAAANSSLLALDEMGEIAGREAGAAAYMLANGQGKARASRSGLARPSARWRLMLLSTGEISLADKVAEAGTRMAPGQEIRLLDIPADDRRFGAFDDLRGKSDGAAFADHVTRAAARSYGSAGPAFVERLTSDMDRHMVALRGAVDDFTAEVLSAIGATETDGQVKRTATRFALIAAAGEAATAFGITGWAPGAAKAAAAEIFTGWLEARGADKGPAEARDAVARTRSFLIEHGASRFERLNETGVIEERILRRAGWRDSQHFYVAADVWRGEVHQGADPVRAARYLLEAGFLVADGSGHLTQRMPRGVNGRPRAYTVVADILGAGDD